MLDDDEWQQVERLLANPMVQIRAYRTKHNVSFSEAKYRWGEAALQRYFELTGYQEENTNALFHHRVVLLGPPCHKCGKPLRTPRASYCAACGWTRDDQPGCIPQQNPDTC